MKNYLVKTKTGDASSPIGRSMIEMLGVLAIIGVLSIGGLYAYRQAMARHNANRLADFINRIQQVVLETCFYNNEKCALSGMTSLPDGFDFLCSSEFLQPEECSVPSENTSYALPYAGLSWRFNRQGSFVLSIYNLPKDICVNLVTKNFRYVGALTVDYGKIPYRKPALNSPNKFSDIQKEQFIKDCQSREKGNMALTWYTEK